MRDLVDQRLLSWQRIDFWATVQELGFRRLRGGVVVDGGDAGGESGREGEAVNPGGGGPTT